jgi:hypothetical protein
MWLRRGADCQRGAGEALNPKVVERCKQKFAAWPAEGTALDQLWQMFVEQNSSGSLDKGRGWLGKRVAPAPHLYFTSPPIGVVGLPPLPLPFPFERVAHRSMISRALV